MEHFKIYLPFTSDYGFKATFGNEHNTLFLRRALQALLDLPSSIERIWFDKNTIEGLTFISRGGTLDLFCRDVNGNEFIVEMQMGIFPNMVQRPKFYAFHKMDKWVKKGDYHFHDLPRIYCVGILGFNLLPGEHYRNVICLRDEAGSCVDDHLAMVFIELEKFHKKPETCHTDLDKLIFAMKEAHIIAKTGEKPPFMEEDWLAVALHELDTRAMSPEERANLNIAIAREASERWRIIDIEADAEERGMKKGMEKGMEKGIEKGLEKGIEKGEIIAQKRLIRNYLRATNATDENVLEVLQVPLALVQEVRREMGQDQ